MQAVTVTLPGRWAVRGTGRGMVGPHAAGWVGGRLVIRPAEPTRYLEQVLADLLLDTLGDGTPAWLAGFESGRRAAAAAGDLIEVLGPTIAVPGAVDRYIYSADLAHRLLFERRWDGGRAGTCVWIMVNPGTGDLLQQADGTRGRARPNRSNLGIAVRRTRTWAAAPPSDLAAWSTVGSVTVLNLFTARSASVAAMGRTARPVGAVSPASRRNHPAADRVLAEEAAGAVAVVGAWGSSGPARLGPSRPEQVRRLVARDGRTVFGVRGTRDGRTVRWLTAGQPRYPQGMPRDAVPVPLDELAADGTMPLP